MKINADRIAADLDLIAGITETPGKGSSRPTFTPQWAMARDYVIAQAKAAGCDSLIDPAGNVHIRQGAFGWTAPAWLSGSHIDSVPHGGKFDGVTGIVVPLEILRAAHEAQRTIPLELVIFAEEEGTTFNLGMLGSRAWAGTLTMNDLGRLKNRNGISFLDAGRPYGVVADQIHKFPVKKGDTVFMPNGRVHALLPTRARLAGPTRPRPTRATGSRPHRPTA